MLARIYVKTLPVFYIPYYINLFLMISKATIHMKPFIRILKEFEIVKYSKYTTIDEWVFK